MLKPNIDDQEIVFNGLLTKDEFFSLIQSIKRDGAIDEDESNRLVKWASGVLAQAELVKLLIEGFCTIDGWNGDAPNIVPTEESINFMADFEQSRPYLEESNYAANV